MGWPVGRRDIHSTHAVGGDWRAPYPLAHHADLFALRIQGLSHRTWLLIKRYIVDFSSLSGGIRANFRNGTTTNEDAENLDWTVQLVETGLHTNTGGALH